MHQGQNVRIVGGAFSGHRGRIVELTATPGLALVSVERASGPSRPSWDTQPVPTWATYYVRVADMAPYREG